jgi:repressor LexA
MPPPNKPGTPRTETQAELYDFIVQFTKSNGFQPSFREIMSEFGWSSPNAVSTTIKALQQKGWITPSKGRRRLILNGDPNRP